MFKFLGFFFFFLGGILKLYKKHELLFGGKLYSIDMKFGEFVKNK